MTCHREKKILPYTAEQLYTLVADVKKYPDFLPWCCGARVRNEKENYLEADLIIGYKFIRETYTSQIQLTPHKRIDVTYLKGPFKHLDNHWIFNDLGDSQCEIVFYVDFEFKSRLLQKLIGTIFTEAVHLMVSSFEKRANQLYSK